MLVIMMQYRMQFVALVLCAAFLSVPIAVLAADAAPENLKADKDRKVTIIDGKKFFSLRDARHFSGQPHSMPVNTKKQFIAPTALQHNQLPAVYSAPARPAATPNNTTSAPVTSPTPGSGNSTGSPVLDIFTPQEKGQ